MAREVLQPYLMQLILATQFVTYRDMPFITMPNLWYFISGGKRSVEKISRAHADGHKIDLDSPEALRRLYGKFLA